MKYFFILAALILSTSASSFAQTEKGFKTIGSNFKLNTTSSSGNTNIYFEAHPRFSYFVSNHWAIGGGLGIADGQQTSAYFISSFTRYYFPIVESKFYLMGEANMYYRLGNEKNTFGILGEAGIAFFPTGRWAIEVGFNLLNFTVENPEGENSSTTTSLNIASTINGPTLGINFYF